MFNCLTIVFLGPTPESYCALKFFKYWKEHAVKKMVEDPPQGMTDIPCKPPYGAAV
jgi:hypothetical protein